MRYRAGAMELHAGEARCHFAAHHRDFARRALIGASASLKWGYIIALIYNAIHAAGRRRRRYERRAGAMAADAADAAAAVTHMTPSASALHLACAARCRHFSVTIYHFRSRCQLLARRLLSAIAISLPIPSTHVTDRGHHHYFRRLMTLFATPSRPPSISMHFQQCHYIAGLYFDARSPLR